MTTSVRTARQVDFDALYAMCLGTPEFQTSTDAPFMEPDEFRACIDNPCGVMLIAERDGTLLGFVYAAWNDLERGPGSDVACLVYLTVRPELRRCGVARTLYGACVDEMRRRGVRRVYGWARDGGDDHDTRGIGAFLRCMGFARGQRYVWMERSLSGCEST